MPQLIPSILETSKEKFLDTYAREIKLPGVERIQVDFGDGIFVPNKILSVTEIDVLNPAFHWEAHLMCREPRDFFDYEICGFKTIILHYEAYPSVMELLAAIGSIKNAGLEPVVCIKPETDVAVLGEFAGQIKQFQLMSVQPGFQGTPFIDSTYDRVKQLRQLLPSAIIEVDGGINETNIKQVAAAGADLIILGSAITKAGNMAEAYEKLHGCVT